MYTKTEQGLNTRKALNNVVTYQTILACEPLGPTTISTALPKCRFMPPAVTRVPPDTGPLRGDSWVMFGF